MAQRRGPVHHQPATARSASVWAFASSIGWWPLLHVTISFTAPGATFVRGAAAWPATTDPAVAVVAGSLWEAP